MHKKPNVNQIHMTTMTIKICRICLALDVKVFKLGNTEAKCFIENIFKQNGYKQDLQETHYICFECKALLDKSYNFIKRALRAQDVLSHIVKENKIVTPTCFKQIDRNITGFHLVKELKYIDVFITDDETQIKKENELLQEVECKVEVDDVPIQDPLQKPEDDCDEFYNIDYTFKSDSPETDTKIDVNSFYNDKEEFEYMDDMNNVIQYEFKETLVERVKKEIQAVKVTKQRTREFLSRSSKLSKKLKKKKPEPVRYDGCVNLARKIQQPEIPKYPAKCDHCSYEVPNRTTHFHHYLLVHKDKKYPYAKQTGKQFVCQYCGLVNTRKSRHIDHELTHGTVSNFTCPQCSKSFVNRNRLQKHTSRSHPRRMLECDYCGKKVKSRDSLKIHMRIHTGEKPFKCHICGAGFAHRGNIRPHIRANHEQYLEQSELELKNKRTCSVGTDMQLSEPENARLRASMFMHLSVMNMNN